VPPGERCHLESGATKNPYSRCVYEITVEDEFCAAHAITIRGEREPLHGHNWRVSVTVTGEQLDGDSLLLDFHALQAIVRRVLAPFHNRDLNATDPFNRINPTAELIAQHIAERVGSGLQSLNQGGLRVAAVRVTEAPGCSVVYRP